MSDDDKPANEYLIEQFRKYGNRPSQQQATAARLADDKRCLAFYEDLKGSVLVYPDLAAGLRDWIKEARSSLHTLAAQPAGTGQTGNCPHCYGTGMRNALND